MTLDATEIMTFRSGQSLFGVPIQNVLSIMGESDKLHCKAFSSKESLGILEYRGTPVAVLDLAVAGNITSDSVAKHALVKQLEDYEQEHVDWVKSVDNAIEDNKVSSIDTDSHHCKFGLWYDSFETDDEDLLEIIKEFKVPHESLHDLIAGVIKQYDHEDKLASTEAITRIRENNLSKLNSIFQRAINQLKSSIKPVFIYLTLDGTTPCAAIRIDEIADVQQVKEDSFVSMEEMAMPQVNDMEYIKGFLKLGEKGDCLLIDVGILTNHRDLNVSEAKSA